MGKVHPAHTPKLKRDRKAADIARNVSKHFRRTLAQLADTLPGYLVLLDVRY